MPDHRIETQFQLGSGKHKAIAREPNGSGGKRFIVALSIDDLVAAQAGATTSQLSITHEDRFLANLPAHRIGSSKRWGGNGCRGRGQLNRHSQWHRFDGEQRPRQEHKGACNEGSDQGCQGRVVFSRHGVVIIET
jgi:hypothetical protein